MAEYIDLEKAIQGIEEDCSEQVYYSKSDAISLLRAQEVADVAPVSHSYWEGYSCSQYMGMDEFGEPKWRDGRFYICHNYRCRRKTVVKSAYCPNCGARMDGDPDGLR